MKQVERGSVNGGSFVLEKMGVVERAWGRGFVMMGIIGFGIG